MTEQPMAIRYQLLTQIERKKIRESRKLTYRIIASESGVSTNTLSKMKNQSLDQIGRVTLDKLCKYFNCQPGDLIIYIPDEELAQSRQGLNGEDATKDLENDSGSDPEA